MQPLLAKDPNVGGPGRPLVVSARLEAIMVAADDKHRQAQLPKLLGQT